MVRRGKSKRAGSDRESTEGILIENFVSLQEVMANLATRFDDLIKQISRLLALFETSANALAKKDFKLEEENKGTDKIIDKMDSLLEQNKIIARGLTLLHESANQQIPQQTEERLSYPKIYEGYRKSISSEPAPSPSTQENKPQQFSDLKKLRKEPEEQFPQQTEERLSYPKISEGYRKSISSEPSPSPSTQNPPPLTQKRGSPQFWGTKKLRKETEA